MSIQTLTRKCCPTALRNQFKFIVVVMLLNITFIILIVLKHGLLNKMVERNDYKPSKELCAFPRILGGDICSKRPNILSNALVLLRAISPFSSSYCAGSLIASKWVLSAAHCFKDLDSGPFFAVKANDAYSKYLGTSLKLAKIKRVFIHPKYTKENYQNDIALAKLETALSGPYVKLNTINGKLPCKVPTVVGLGWTSLNSSFDKPSEPLCVEVSMISTPHCSILNKIPAELMEGKYCTTTGCYKGDSGGPLLCNNIQIGIVSISNTFSIKPVLHTRVDAYYDSFIRPIVSAKPVLKKKSNLKIKSNVKRKIVKKKRN